MQKKNFSAELILIFPVFLFMIVFYVYPLIKMLSLSFFNNNNFTFVEYINIFKTGLYSKVFLNSVKTSLLVTTFSFLIGYPLAYFITYSKQKVLLFGIVAISMWLGIIIRSFGWMG